MRVRGPLGPRVLDALDHPEVRTDADGTRLITEVEDQAALVGLVRRVNALGLELLEVVVDQPVAGTPSSSRFD